MKLLQTAPNLLVSVAACLQLGCTPDKISAVEEDALPLAGSRVGIERQIASGLRDDGGCDFSQVRVKKDGRFVQVTGGVSGWDCRCRVEDVLRGTRGLRGYVLNLASLPPVQSEGSLPEMDLDQGEMTQAASKIVRGM